LIFYKQLVVIPLDASKTILFFFSPVGPFPPPFSDSLPIPVLFKRGLQILQISPPFTAFVPTPSPLRVFFYQRFFNPRPPKASFPCPPRFFLPSPFWDTAPPLLHPLAPRPLSRSYGACLRPNCFRVCECTPLPVTCCFSPHLRVFYLGNMNHFRFHAPAANFPLLTPISTRYQTTETRF